MAVCIQNNELPVFFKGPYQRKIFVSPVLAKILLYPYPTAKWLRVFWQSIGELLNNFFICRYMLIFMPHHPSPKKTSKIQYILLFFITMKYYAYIRPFRNYLDIRLAFIIAKKIQYTHIVIHSQVTVYTNILVLYFTVGFDWYPINLYQTN